MNELKVMDTLRAILEELGIPKESLREDTLLYEQLGIDSVEVIQLSLELKRRLGIDVKIGTRNDMTLAEICHLAEAHVLQTRSKTQQKESQESIFSRKT